MSMSPHHQVSREELHEPVNSFEFMNSPDIKLKLSQYLPTVRLDRQGDMQHSTCEIYKVASSPNKVIGSGEIPE
jgi:hypothetical protein